METRRPSRLFAASLQPATNPGRLEDQRQKSSHFLQLPRRPIVGVLENIRSLWNVGSIFRSADATRLQELYLCGFTGHPPRAEIDKTALGAAENVPWSYWSSSREALRWLKESGYRILALELTPHSQPLENIDLAAPLAFVVGNEVTGVSSEALALCDAAIEIPMDGMKQSLNVAVAFGVLAYGLAARLPIPASKNNETGKAGVESAANETSENETSEIDAPPA